MRVADATHPEPGTPAVAATAQRRLRILQWMIPGLTGAVVILSARAGEQLRPAAVTRGVKARFRS